MRRVCRQRGRDANAVLLSRARNMPILSTKASDDIATSTRIGPEREPPQTSVSFSDPFPYWAHTYV